MGSSGGESTRLSQHASNETVPRETNVLAKHRAEREVRRHCDKEQREIAERAKAKAHTETEATGRHRAHQRDARGRQRGKRPEHRREAPDAAAPATTHCTRRARVDADAIEERHDRVRRRKACNLWH